MALQRISIDVDGESQYARGFELMAHEAEDLSEPLGEVGEAIRRHVAEQFLTEGGAGMYGKWQALNPEYEAWKMSQVGPQPILVYTGALFTKATADSAIRTTPRKLVYEIDDPKAIYHQRGSGNLPQRKIVDMSTEMRRSIDRIFASWVHRIRRGPMWS